jgi:hypothetical protein
MSVIAAFGLFVVGSAVVYGLVMCLAPRGGHDHDAAPAHHGHH